MSTTFSCLVTSGSIYILQLEGTSHIHLYAIYMRRGYTVLLENKLRKYGLVFKEVKSTTRISYLIWRDLLDHMLNKWKEHSHLFSFFRNLYNTLYSTANDPETANDPQNGPQMILVRK